MSAFVESGSGGSWVVEMFDGSADKYALIGDFSSAGGDWTLVSLTVTSDDLPKYYLDTNVDSEVLVRVTSDSVGSLQVGLRARRTSEMPVDANVRTSCLCRCVCASPALPHVCTEGKATRSSLYCPTRPDQCHHTLHLSSPALRALTGETSGFILQPYTNIKNI